VYFEGQPGVAWNSERFVQVSMFHRRVNESVGDSPVNQQQLQSAELKLSGWILGCGLGNK